MKSRLETNEFCIVAVNELDITIQSAHPSALFKTEANLILRLSRCIKDENQSKKKKTHK